MAYTKTPVQSTQQHKRFNFSHNAVPSYNMDSGRGIYYKNCAPVAYRNVGGGAHWQVENRPFLGTTSLITSGTTSQVFNGAGHSVAADGSTVSVSVFNGNIFLDGVDTTDNTNGKAVSIIPVPTGVMILERDVATGYLHYYNTSTETLSSTTLTNLGPTGDIVYLDGYTFIACNDRSSGRQRIYNTTYGTTHTVDTANDYIDAEQYPDDIVSLATHKNHVVAFGECSIEFFYDAGNPLGSPLQRNLSYSVQIGMHAPSLNFGTTPLPTTAKIADDIYFISSKGSVGLGVWRIKNFAVEKVSDTYIDRILNHFNDDYEAAVNTYLYPSKAQMIGVSSIFAYNEACILLQWVENVDLNHRVRYFLFQPTTGIWSEFEFQASQGSPFFFPIGDPMQGTRLLMSKTEDYLYFNNLHVAEWYPSAKGYVTETVKTELVTPYIDCDSHYMKHMIFADVIGRFNPADTTVELSVSKSSDQVDYISYGTKIGASINDGAARFRNLGRARQMSFKINTYSTSPVILEYMDLRYEQGTQ